MKTYKVTIIEKEYTLKFEGKKEVSRSLYDTRVYLMVMKGNNKQHARVRAKRCAKGTLKPSKTSFTQVSVGKAYKCWNGLLYEEGQVFYPHEKDIARDSNWRETIKEMV